MNRLHERAERERRLKSLYVVLKRELISAKVEKEREISKFALLADEERMLKKYQKDSGLTTDICERILLEVQNDLVLCEKFQGLHAEQNAIDGECDLRPLYRAEARVPIVWTAKDGQKPVDLIILGIGVAEAMLGDCKFGLKREDPWMIRKKEQFDTEFLDKFLAVGRCILTNDNVSSRPEMLLIVTSAISPLLKNRIEDFKLDPVCAGIPYDKVRVCSVEDIYSVCQELLPGFAVEDVENVGNVVYH